MANNNKYTKNTFGGYFSFYTMKSNRASKLSSPNCDANFSPSSWNVINMETVRVTFYLVSGKLI